MKKLEICIYAILRESRFAQVDSAAEMVVNHVSVGSNAFYGVRRCDLSPQTRPGHPLCENTIVLKMAQNGLLWAPLPWQFESTLRRAKKNMQHLFKMFDIEKITQYCPNTRSEWFSLMAKHCFHDF